MFFAHDLRQLLKGHKFVAVLFQQTNDSFDPFAVSADTLLDVVPVVGAQLPDCRDFLFCQLKGVQVEYVVIIFTDVAANQRLDKKPRQQPYIAAAGDGQRLAEDFSSGNAKLIKVPAAENAPAQPMKVLQIQLDRVAGRQKIQVAGIIAEAKLLQYVQPGLVHTEAGCPEANHVNTKELPHLLLCQAGLFPELVYRYVHRRHVLVAVQGQRMSVCNAGLQPACDLGGKLANGK